jgi:serine/threonine protein kinase
VELIDFGSVTKFSANQRTKITSRLLTPAYAPLEQYGQEVMLTPSTDLYALAATIYEAMTGVAPVPALDRANGKKLEPLQNLAPHVTPEFSRMLMKALELRIEDRFSSSHELEELINPLKSNVSDKVSKGIRPDLYKIYRGMWALFFLIIVYGALMLSLKVNPKAVNSIPKPADTCESVIKELDQTNGDFSKLSKILERAKKLNCLPKGF